MTNKKKIMSSVIAVAMAAVLLIGGTFAWQSISQQALNEKEAIVNPGGRLHDDFNGENKDVYVENFAEDEIFARIRLDEYFEIIVNRGTAAQKTEVITEGATRDELDTYITHLFGEENATDEYWQWTTGGSTVFMPTFNKNKDSLAAEVNGTLENNYEDYSEYEVGDEITANATYDNDSNNVEDENVVEVEETHNAKETATATLLGMDEWMNDYGSEPGDYWVYDTDGWVYYAKPIEAGEATGLLLDKIALTEVMDDSYYYAINVVAQFITADDLGKDDATGFYADGQTVSDNALTLLEKIGVNVGNAEDEVEETSPLVLTENARNTKDIVKMGSDFKFTAKNGDDVLTSPTGMTLEFFKTGETDPIKTFTESEITYGEEDELFSVDLGDTAKEYKDEFLDVKLTYVSGDETLTSNIAHAKYCYHEITLAENGTDADGGTAGLHAVVIKIDGIDDISANGHSAENPIVSYVSITQMGSETELTTEDGLVYSAEYVGSIEFDYDNNLITSGTSWTHFDVKMTIDGVDYTGTVKGGMPSTAGNEW